MSEYRVQHCRGRTCRAPIIWAVTSPGGKSMPVDAAEDDDGNVELIPNPDPNMAPTAVVHGTPPMVAQGTFHQPHFATCENAEDWKRK